MNTTELNPCGTFDIYFAAYVMALGHEMTSADKINDVDRGRQKNYFVFNVSVDEFNNLKQTYFNETGMVSAIKHMSCFRNLKNMCFL